MFLADCHVRGHVLRYGRAYIKMSQYYMVFEILASGTGVVYIMHIGEDNITYL